MPAGVVKLKTIMGNFVLEASLLSGVCWLLHTVGEPLGHAHAMYGLAGRYPVLPPQLNSPLSLAWLQHYGATLLQGYVHGLPLQDTLAVLVASHAGAVISAIATVGWVSLLLARRGTSPAWALGVWVPTGFFLGLDFTALVGISCIVVMAAVVRAKMPSPPMAMQQPHPLHALVWPGWIFLAGIQWLTLVDFAARGPLVPGGMGHIPPEVGARYFGLWQMHGLVYASVAMCAVAACREPLLQLWIGLCTRLELWVNTQGGLLRVLLTAVVFALALGWLGFSKNQNQNYLHIAGLHGLGKPHLSGEILKLLACWTLAWFAYRVSEWPISRGRMRLALKGALCVMLISAGGLVLSDDKGPLLVLALSVPLLFGIPWLGRAHTPMRRFAVCGLLVVACIGIWHTVLMEVIPLVSRQAMLRAHMAENPYTAYRPTLAQAMWLMDAIPERTWLQDALGKVPYCGAKPLLELAECSLGTGSPIQMPSDLGYTLLYASFGPLGALLIAAFLVCWGASLLTASLPAPLAHGAPAAQQYALLGAWMVAVPTLVALAQLLVSAGALLGWSALTGITFPLGYGRAALVGTALWVGLAFRRTH